MDEGAGGQHHRDIYHVDHSWHRPLGNGHGLDTANRFTPPSLLPRPVRRRRSTTYLEHPTA